MRSAHPSIGVTKQEQKDLVKQIRSGPKAEAKAARRELTNLGQFWVATVASKYINRDKTFSQLMKAGNRGLRKAIKRYSLGKKYKFSTYATWWIRDAIIKELVGAPRKKRPGQNQATKRSQAE